MYLQKVRNKQKKNLLTPWRSLTKIAGSGSASGSIQKFHGSATLLSTMGNWWARRNAVGGVRFWSNGVYIFLEAPMCWFYIEVCNCPRLKRHVSETCVSFYSLVLSSLRWTLSGFRFPEIFNFKKTRRLGHQNYPTATPRYKHWTIRGVITTFLGIKDMKSSDFALTVSTPHINDKGRSNSRGASSWHHRRQGKNLDNFLNWKSNFVKHSISNR